LKGAELQAAQPLVGGIKQQPGFTTEMLRLQWRPNDPVDVFIVTPKVAAKPPTVAVKPPVVLYLYNYTTNTDRFLNDKVCAYLVKNGVAAVGFSTAISGYRFRGRGATEWFVSDLQEALAESAHDVQMVINYLETRKDIDTSRIGVYGNGSGAAVAILTASVDPRIKVLDLEDTWGDWPEWLAQSTIIPEAERPTYLKADFLKCVAGLDPVDYLPKLKIPLRNQYSAEKSPVPADVRKRIEAALPPQAAHTPIDVTFDWISNQLKEMSR
jgi:hypothetical protein